jgi:hypothetical protein
MMALELLVLVSCFLICWIIASQVILPALTGRSLFPVLRPSARALARRRNQTRDRLADAETELALTEEQAKVAKLQKRVRAKKAASEPDNQG